MNKLCAFVPFTIISTECVCLAGVSHVKTPESSFEAWYIDNLYSSCESLPGSAVHPSGYFL